jgi:bifunctional non-homologous end joining protein LigD
VAAEDVRALNWRTAVPAGRTKKKKVGTKKPLKDYAGKRDFARTPEPAGSGQKADGWEFVVQKHAARRLHCDLRIEMDGVLKSWAVTRGPSLKAGEKRLAFRTEDHPIDYLDFEGNIPKGEYGAGSMIVWDRGRWEPEGDPRKSLAKGHLAFTLNGARLKGRWHLVRMQPRSGEKAEPWLLIKSDDTFARHSGDPEIIDEEATSRLSGRTNEELVAAGEIRQDHAARTRVAKARKIVLPEIAKLSGARAGLLPTFLEPSLALPCEKPPSSPKWIHEIKYDGYRMQARIDGRKIRLLTRKKLDWTERFSRIAEALKALALGSALIDGEITVEDESGISSFNDLQVDLKAGRSDRFRYFVFDILYCEGFDLTKAVLKDRKGLLQLLLAGLPPSSPLRFSEHLDVDGATMLAHACRYGLEGIISKRADLPHCSGRGGHWLKSKCIACQEFVVLGYVPSTVTSRSAGSLALGYYDNQNLVYAGRVGTGWSQQLAKALRDELETIRAARPPFAKQLPAGAENGVRWAEPRLVCEIEYRGWTRDRLLRAAAFKGLRDDRAAEEIVLEAPPQRSRPRTKQDQEPIRLTHPERILWEEAGITKRGLAEFYTEIADWILPHLAGRPLGLLRCPSGTGAKCFFAKHPWQGLDKRVRRVDTGDEKPMVTIGDLTGLISLVQAGVIEIHPWGSSIDKLEQPDRLIFDLDPGDNVPWPAVVEAAHDVHGRLAALGLQSFVKTSGGKGLHVVVPIKPEAGWEETKNFAKAIAERMAKERPERYVATLAKRARRGRVFVDYLRNDRGATAVATYSTRALPRAPVSTPLSWDELSPGLRSAHFTVGNLLHRLSSQKRDPWQGFFKIRQRLPPRRR